MKIEIKTEYILTRDGSGLYTLWPKDAEFELMVAFHPNNTAYWFNSSISPIIDGDTVTKDKVSEFIGGEVHIERGTRCNIIVTKVTETFYKFKEEEDA